VSNAPEHADLPRHLVLVGMMGSGKTTVGHRLAARLDRPFFDSDEMIEAREGRTVRDIWLEDGEPVYRQMETEVLREALAAPVDSVVAAAGGVVLREENRRLLEAPDVFTVRLDADPEVLVARVGRQDHRPLLDDDPLGTLRRMAAEREDLYAEVADATIDVSKGRPDELADEVLAAVGAARG
jgi:shikimate kinase